MTSDTGSAGGTDMQLASLPVTPKTAGLNPNANVFHCKVPPTPPDSTPEWAVPSNEFGKQTASQFASHASEDNNLVNGDGGLLTPQKISPVTVSFPPTPESPALPPPVTDIAIQFTNGGLPSPPPTISPTSNTSAATTSDHSDCSNVSVAENGVPQDQLKNLLKTQLEYYFSRENLANDSYLVSQMDGDQYVSITIVANFNQVKRLTNNLDLVIEALRDSPNVQVDDKGEKVRPLHKRCVVILREVPESTPVSDVEHLFSGVNCPPFLSIEFAHNNNWYITFPTDEDAQRAYQYLREDVRTFQGRPIMARIKAKPLVRTSLPPKNGFKQSQSNYDPPVQPQQKMSGSFQSNQGYAPFTPVPTTPQYIISQPVSQQSYPFFPPNTVVQPWPQPNPMPFFDPGSAFAANGYTAAATFKMPANNNAAPQNSGNNANAGRHTYQSSKNRNQKPHRNNSSLDYERTGNQSDTRSMNQRVDRVMNDRTMNELAMNERTSDRLINARMDRGLESRNMDNRNHGSHDRPTSRSHSNTDGPYINRSTRFNQNSYNNSSHSSFHVPSSGTQAHAVHSGPPSSSSSLSIGSHSSMPVQDGHHNRSSPPLQPSAPRFAESNANKDSSAQLAVKKSNYRSRRRKEEEIAKPIRSTANLTQQPPPKDVAKPLPVTSPKFDLEATAFPPLPGGQSQSKVPACSTSGEIFENKMSDVVKGTAKAMTREISKPTSNPVSTSNTSSSSPASKPTSTLSQQSNGKSLAPNSTNVVTASIPESTDSTTSQSNPQQLSSSSTNNVSKANKEDKSSTSGDSQVPVNAKQVLVADDCDIPKLSYAAMLQRSKEIREAAAAAAAASSAEGQEKQSTPSNGDPANTSTSPACAAGGPAPSRPPALREQMQASSSQHGSASCAEVVLRKNRDLKEEPRLSDTRGPRQLKENRERRDMRDVRDSRDQRDRFSRDRPFPPRERRRDYKDQEPREPKINASK